AAFNQAPVGTGAFKWAQRTAGDHIELVANADYAGEGPYLERLVFKYIPDMTVLYTQFKSGDIDLVDQAFITADHYAEASKLSDRVVMLERGSSVESIYLNLEKPQFKDPAVRQALYAAIDRKAILEALYYGVHTPTETFMPQNSYYYNPNLPAQEFNIERAGQILDEAGWVPGADGIRAKDGVRLSFANSTTSGNHLREQTQQFLQQTFAEIGVEMTISNLPAAVMWGDFWLKSQFESAISGVTNLIAGDPDVFNRLHTKAIVAKGGKGSNTGQYSNPEVDALLEKGARTFDREQRRAIYLRVQEIVRQDLPFLPLFAYTNVFGCKEGLEGFEANSNTRVASWHAAGWYWKA
ncbi:MAG: peptide ABC transporter substrate-binding protein, partial [Mesorhizobium sp.]